MTNRTFQDMLNEYLTYDLLKEELIKRDYVYRKVEKDTGWKGGTLPVPFKGSEATSVRFGALTNQGDISQHKYVRGQISDYKEAWIYFDGNGEEFSSDSSNHLVPELNLSLDIAFGIYALVI